MTINIFQRYAATKEKIAGLEAELDAMREQVMAQMDEGEKETEWGTFVIRWIKKWSYTPAVEKAELKLKALKATEQASGDATAEERKVLAYIQ